MVCNIERCYDKVITNREMCDRRDQCVVFCDRRSIPKCSENGKQYKILNNTHTVLAYRVDGGVIIENDDSTIGKSKCDYLFIVMDESAPKSILIELKGKDVNKALKQISATLNYYGRFFEKMDRTYGRIVCSGSPPRIRNTPEYVELSKRLMRMKGNLKIGERVLEDDYASLA